MTLTIGGVAVPDSMQDAGQYIWSPEPVLDEDGFGVPVLGEFSSAVWTFAQMTNAEFDWWASTVCQNNRAQPILLNSALPTEYPDPARLQTFQRIRVWRPEVGDFNRGLMINVVVRIDRMVRDFVA